MLPAVLVPILCLGLVGRREAGFSAVGGGPGRSGVREPNGRKAVNPSTGAAALALASPPPRFSNFILPRRGLATVKREQLALNVTLKGTRKTKDERMPAFRSQRLRRRREPRDLKGQKTLPPRHTPRGARYASAIMQPSHASAGNLPSVKRQRYLFF